MKRVCNYRKAVAGVLAAALTLSVLSCRKEDTGNPPGSPEEVAFRLSLRPRVDTLVYPGRDIALPFRVLSGGTDVLKVVSREGEGARVSVKLSGNRSGIITVTPESASGSARAVLSNGTREAAFRLAFHTYHLAVDGTPPSIGDGKAASFTLRVDTNLPDGSVVVSSDPWISASYGGGKLSVSLEENPETGERKGSIVVSDTEGILQSTTIAIVQGGRQADSPSLVLFADPAFKAAAVAVADTDGDGEVSFQEALAVRELDIAGRGVTDLRGLEAFQSLWKLDARDNAITDGSVLKDLPLLHWLDLKGNRGLSTFDVTGCSVYFEHCEFEVTKDLVYYTTRQQINVTNACDPLCEHSRHLVDSRETADWSDQDEVVLLREHTEGTGYPMALMGISYLDRDMKDGSFVRLMRDFLEVVVSSDPDMKDYAKYVDFYAVKHMAVNRNLYYIDPGECVGNADLMLENAATIHRDQLALFDSIYGRLAEDAGAPFQVYPLFVELNPLGTSDKPAGACYVEGVLTDRSAVSVVYLHTYMDDADESSYAGVQSHTPESWRELLELGVQLFERDYLEKYIKH